MGYRYIVVEAGSGNELRDKVDPFLQDGYIPQGGVMIVHYGEGDFLYAQAMILRD